MSYRATVITEFLYRACDSREREKIRRVLDKYGSFRFSEAGSGTGYFHGIVKGLCPDETQRDEKEMAATVLEETGVRIRFVHEIE